MAERERKPGFIYIKSEILKQEIAMSEKTGWVFCEDKVRYSPQETQILDEAGAKIDLRAHLVKKVFGGDVVKIERRQGTSVEGGRIESQQRDNAADNTSSGKEAPGAAGISAGNADEELGIF